MPAIGVLSKKTLFPLRGDVFFDGEVSWECVHAHVHIDPLTSQRMRYVFVVGRLPGEDTPMPWALDESAFPKFLKSIETVRREKKGETKVYHLNAQGNFAEET